eukprot:122987-Chlamydomonas_euryale.AAC.5
MDVPAAMHSTHAVRAAWRSAHAERPNGGSLMHSGRMEERLCSARRVEERACPMRRSRARPTRYAPCATACAQCTGLRTGLSAARRSRGALASAQRRWQLGPAARAGSVCE